MNRKKNHLSNYTMEKLYLSFYKLLPAKQLKPAAAIAFVFIMATLSPCKLLAQAPTVSYTSPHTYFSNLPVTLAPVSTNVDAPAYNSGVVLGSGLSFSQNDVALDAAGNMYVNDIETTGEVKKISADGSSTTIIASGFLAQSANIAIDPAGNVYVVDQAALWKVPASGSPVTYGTPVVISRSFRECFGLAVDPAGNIYVTDFGAGGVYKMANDGSNMVRIDNGLSQPSAVALDAAGNVYATDVATQALYEIPANGNPQLRLATGLGFPRGLAVDAGGTVYVDDEGNSGIYAVPAGGGTPVAVVSGLSNLVGVAVDAGNNLYAALQGNGGITKYSPTGGYFISPALPAGLNLDKTTGVISHKATVASAATDYIVSAYNSTGSTTATVNITIVNAIALSYSTPQTFTAGTAITALDPSVTTGTVGSPGYSATPVSIGSGFNNPSAVAVDAAGNVYMADAFNAAVKKIPADGGPPVSIGSGFVYPTGVAVDAAGDVFVADPSAGLVSEIPVSGSQSTLGSGFVVTPVAVAVDQSGNVYVIDGGGSTLFKIPAGNGTPVLLGSGFNELTALTVDQSGNLYVVDGGASIVYEVSEKGGVPVDVGGSFVFPTGVAVDASGIVYVTDSDAGTIYKLSACGCTEVAIGTGFNEPNGLAIDGAGNVYVADSGNNLVDMISPVGGYFVNTTLPAGLRMNDTTGVISGKPKKLSTAANYIITGWDADGPGSAIVNITVVAPPVPVISYATPQTYVAGTAITPLNPSNSGGAVAFPAYNDTPINIGSGFSSPYGVALDAAGDIYIADAGNGAIKKITVGNFTPATVASGFDYPTAVAVDAAGDLFIADQGAHAVYEIPFGGSQQTIANFSEPNGVAVDASGNVFVSDESSNTVYKLGSGSPTIVASGFFDLTNLTVDSSGNIYITDGGGSALYEVPKSGGVPIPIGNFFLYPTAVTVDAIGNIYVADGDAGTIFKLPKGTFAQIPIANGFNEPGGVAVDGIGNVYIGDTNNNMLEAVTPAGGYFLDSPLPAGLSLDSKTGIISGTATGASPAKDYTITGYNAGGVSATQVNITVNLPPLPVITYATPQTYSQGIAITTLLPTSSNVDIPTYSAALDSVGSAFNAPTAVAVDTKGDIFIADEGNKKVWELPVGTTGLKLPIGSGFFDPTGVAVDTAGNVYVADGSSSRVIKVPPGGPQVFLGTGYTFPGAIAVDAAGNAYVADAGTGAVYRIAAGHNNKTTFATGFIYPAGVAVDNLGNVFVADAGSGGGAALYKIAAGTGTRTQIPVNFILVTGVTVDASGNLFAIDLGAGQIVEIPSGSAPNTATTQLGYPFGVAADGSGHLYVPDVSTNKVFKITPTGGYYINAALPAGLNFESTTGTITGTPTTLSPARDFTVSAYNVSGGTTATVNIKVAATNANLSHFVISPGAINPFFATLTTSYSTTVPNSSSTITITPTTVDPNATISINGSPAASGSPFVVNSLVVGSNTVTTIVTAQDGVTTKTYTLAVTRAPSTNAGLAAMNPSSGPLTPAFSPGTASYTLAVGNATGSITITPVTSEPNATLTVNGSPATSGAAFGPIALSVAGPNVITVTVLAQDGVATKTYTLTVTRARSAVASLSNIQVDNGVLKPAFAPATPSYTDRVPNVSSSVSVTPTATDPTASITVNGSPVSSGSPVVINNLVVGDNSIFMLVTSQDGSTQKTYSLTVTRALSINASLASINPNISPLSPAFTPGTASYTLDVSNATTTMTIAPVTADPNATFTINGSPATSGSTFAINNLAVGPNTITTAVTAQDGTTKKTYTITVTRTGSPNANLSNIQVSNGVLTPAFVPVTTTYTDRIPNGSTTITITPTVAEPHATIKVNGTAVASGSPFVINNLVTGPNTITTVVTAQDGSTQKTYTLTVTRWPSINASLASMNPGTGHLAPVFAPGTLTYTMAVGNGVSSLTFAPVTSDPNATMTINTSPATSGAVFGPITLAVGANVIDVTVLAQDGVTTKTYTVTVTRATPGSGNTAYQPVGVEKPVESLSLGEDGIAVHQGISPNGDGINDFLIIENISQYPDNKLAIMNRNGQLVYETKGYDNSSKVFDGRSSKDGHLQLPGTYFYSLDYTVKGIAKHKTGFIVLKY